MDSIPYRIMQFKVETRNYTDHKGQTSDWKKYRNCVGCGKSVGRNERYDTIAKGVTVISYCKVCYDKALE